MAATAGIPSSAAVAALLLALVVAATAPAGVAAATTMRLYAGGLGRCLRMPSTFAECSCTNVGTYFQRFVFFRDYTDDNWAYTYTNPDCRGQPSYFTESSKIPCPINGIRFLSFKICRNCPPMIVAAAGKQANILESCIAAAQK